MSKPAPVGGRRKKKMSGADLFHGADDKVDEYTQSTWTNSKTANAGRARASKDSSDPPQPNTTALHNNNADNSDKELLYQQLNNRSKKRNMRQKHVKSSSASGVLKLKKSSKWWQSRHDNENDRGTTSKKAMTPKLSATKANAATNNNKNIIIKINHINKREDNKTRNKSQKHGKHKKHKHQNVTFNVEPEQQILGDILIHTSSWNHLMSKHETQNSTKQKLIGVGWKKIYSTLDRETICFWDNSAKHDDNHTNIKNAPPHITIYLSEILTLSKSIRTIDGEKYIIELNVDGSKCWLSFSNIEQREYWHSLLSDYHLNYFVWRSTPLDESHRRSQNVIHGVYKLLKSQKQSVNTTHSTMDNINTDTLNILYIEEILQKISDLNITKIIDLVPTECRFMCGRLIRVIMSIKFFFMSVLKSLSGADIPLPSRDILMSYLDEIADIEWETTKREVLDFYCDQCYRILFHLSFAFTSNARDEIMKLNEYIDFKNKRQQKKAQQPQQQQQLQDAFEDERKIAEMKFEYESLQRSWKMHRDRLQEYVMAYRDAVAKLKHSYHQRDNLCKKIESVQKENKQMNESIKIQNKTYNRTIEEAQKLTEKFAILSQQMQNAQVAQNQIIDNLNHKKKIKNSTTKTKINAQYPVASYAPQYPLSQPGAQQKGNNTSYHQIHQISQEMSDLFNGLNHTEHDNNKYTWI